VAVIKAAFPRVEIGDIEPLAAPQQPGDWLSEISQWIVAYGKAVGTPLHSFDADLTWSGPWQPQLRSLASTLRAAGVSFGVIYDGDSTDSTGVEWVQHAVDRFTQVESNPATTPDRAILQSWTLQPSHMLPETEPGTMTYLVNSYLRRPVALSLRHEERRLFGRLADASGAPVAGAKVALSAANGSSARDKSVRTVAGVVPAAASRAIVAVRINAECGCSGVAQVDIGRVSYRDSKTNVTLLQPLLANPSDNNFVAAAGQAVSRNSQPLAVAAGAPFAFEVSMGATAASTGSGYIAIVFLDASGRELERLRIPFSPASTELGTAVTDASGGFSVPLTGANGGPGTSYHASFSGDTSNRPAAASL
jgi:hypothetical protein